MRSAKKLSIQQSESHKKNIEIEIMHANGTTAGPKPKKKN